MPNIFRNNKVTLLTKASTVYFGNTLHFKILHPSVIHVLHSQSILWDLIVFGVFDYVLIALFIFIEMHSAEAALAYNIFVVIFDAIKLDKLDNWDVISRDIFAGSVEKTLDRALVIRFLVF